MIYGYARVSTATQGRDGNSLEDQVSALEKYGCQKIVKEAFTGKTMDRPQFMSLLENLREGDTLVVCKLDRFARNRYDSAIYKARLKKNGVRVMSAKENIADDASGILVEGVLVKHG